MADRGDFGYVWRQSSPTTTYAVCNDVILSTGRIIYQGTTFMLGGTTSTTQQPQSPTDMSSASSVQYLLETADPSLSSGRSSLLSDASATATAAPTNANYIVAPIMTYSPFCIRGTPVTYVRESALKSFFMLLTTDTKDWQTYINSGAGLFRSSLFPLLYSISICMFISWVLNLAAFISRRKRPKLQLLAMALSTVYLTMIFALAVDNMQDQYATGYLEAHSLDDVFSRRYVFGVCIGFNTILLFSQVQTTIGLFPRQKEKRLIFWIGIVMDIVAQVLWGISVTEHSEENILAAFVYLLQIAISTLYAFCVTVYFVNRRKVALQLNMLFLTTITMFTVVLPIVLFIVDVNSWWIVNWVDSLSWTSTLLSIITVWEWSQYVEEIHSKQEHSKILGYQFYDDSYADVCGDIFEYQNLANDFESYPKESKDDDSDDDEHEGNDNAGHGHGHRDRSRHDVDENSIILALDRGPSWIPAMFNSPSPTPSPFFWHFVSHGIIDPFVKVTDMVVAFCSTPKSKESDRGGALNTSDATYMDPSSSSPDVQETEVANRERYFHPPKRPVARLNTIISIAETDENDRENDSDHDEDNRETNDQVNSEDNHEVNNETNIDSNHDTSNEPNNDKSQETADIDGDIATHAQTQV